MNALTDFAGDPELTAQLNGLDRDELRDVVDRLAPYLRGIGRRNLLWCIASARAASAERRSLDLLKRANAAFEAYAAATDKARARRPGRSTMRAFAEAEALWSTYQRRRRAAERSALVAPHLREEENVCWCAVSEELR